MMMLCVSYFTLNDIDTNVGFKSKLSHIFSSLGMRCNKKFETFDAAMYHFKVKHTNFLPQLVTKDVSEPEKKKPLVVFQAEISNEHLEYLNGKLQFKVSVTGFNEGPQRKGLLQRANEEIY